MEHVEMVERLLPAWFGWAPFVVAVGAAAALSWLCAWLGVRLAGAPLRRLEDGPWAERARLAYPPRMVSQILLSALPATVATVATVLVGPLSRVGAGTVALVAAITAFFPAIGVHLRLNRAIGRPCWRLLPWTRDVAAILLGLYPHLVLVLVVLVAGPSRFGAGAVVLLGLVALLTVAAAWGVGLRLARLVGLARRASPRLERIVATAAERLNVRPPSAVFELRWEAANAFAYPLGKALVFTRGALAQLSDEELTAVCAHELGHLLEPARHVALRCATAALVMAVLAAAKPMALTFGPYSPVIAFLGVVVVLRLFRRFALRGERRADVVGRTHEGGEGTYARAIERLYRANVAPAVMPGRAPTHPHLYDRMVEAGVAPDYPRPAPPSRLRTLVPLLVSVLLAVALYAGLFLGARWVNRSLSPPDASSEDAFLLTAAVYGGGGHELAMLGYARTLEGRYEEAVAFYGAAALLEPESTSRLADLVLVLAESRRCEEAAVVLEAAFLDDEQVFLGAEDAPGGPGIGPRWQAAALAVARCVPLSRRDSRRSVPRRRPPHR